MLSTTSYAHLANLAVAVVLAIAVIWAVIVTIRDSGIRRSDTVIAGPPCHPSESLKVPEEAASRIHRSSAETRSPSDDRWGLHGLGDLISLGQLPLPGSYSPNPLTPMNLASALGSRCPSYARSRSM